MTLPVVESVAQAYPDTEFTLLSQRRFAPIFANISNNVKFIGIDITEYRGIDGVMRLYRELKRMNFDAVANLHGVLRGNIIAAMLHLNGLKVCTIRKGRYQRFRLTRQWCKHLSPLPTSLERYCNVFERMGFHFQVDFQTIFKNGGGEIERIVSTTGPKQGYWIGVAPFAAHRGKIYPLNRMESVVEALYSTPNIRIFLFAYGKEELQIREWLERYPQITLIKGQLDMCEELVLMNHLDLMIAMDSSNSHLASIVGTRVLSIWGATHPMAGFAPYGQDPKNSIQANIKCRPCSIYGKRECWRGDYRCMTAINPQEIIERATTLLASATQHNS